MNELVSIFFTGFFFALASVGACVLMVRGLRRIMSDGAVLSLMIFCVIAGLICVLAKVTHG